MHWPRTADGAPRATGNAPKPAQINRLAGLAVMLHCLLPASWVPPLATPTAQPESPDAPPRVRGRGPRDWEQLLPAGSGLSDAFFEPPQPPPIAQR